MTAVETVERANMVQRPAIKPGDTVRVHVKVREGDKERIQVFEGMVIGMHRGGARATFTVRKVSFGQGVELEQRHIAGALQETVPLAVTIHDVSFAARWDGEHAWDFDYDEHLFVQENGDVTRNNGRSHLDTWDLKPDAPAEVRVP